MRILDLICLGSLTFLALCVLTFVVMVFCTGIYACFTKKVKGELFAKITIAIVSGCCIPWLIKGVIFLFTKILS